MHRFDESATEARLSSRLLSNAATAPPADQSAKHSHTKRALVTADLSDHVVSVCGVLLKKQPPPDDNNVSNRGVDISVVSSTAPIQ